MADKIVKKTGYIFVEDGKEHRASEKTFNDYGGIEAYKADSPNTKVRMQKDGKLYDIPLSRYDEAAEWGYSLYKYEKNDTIKEPDFSEFERKAPDFAEYENKPTNHVQPANLDAPQPGVPVVSESDLGIGDEPAESTRVALPTLENLTSGVAPTAPSAEDVNPTSDKTTEVTPTANAVPQQTNMPFQKTDEKTDLAGVREIMSRAKVVDDAYAEANRNLLTFGQNNLLGDKKAVQVGAEWDAEQKKFVSQHTDITGGVGTKEHAELVTRNVKPALGFANSYEDLESEVDRRIADVEKRTQAYNVKRKAQAEQERKEGRTFYQRVIDAFGEAYEAEGTTGAEALRKELENPEYKNLFVESILLDNAKKRIEASKLQRGDGFWDWQNAKNIGSGLSDAVANPETFGGASISPVIGLELARVSDKWAKGQELTEDEKNLAVVAALYQEAQSLEVPLGYTTGEVTGLAIPFMIEIAANPTRGTSNAIANKIMTDAVRRFGLRGVGKTATKIASRVVGDVAESAALAGTLQAPKVVGEAGKRRAGKAQYTLDANNNVRGVSFKERESNAEALAKSFATMTITNFTEKLSESLDVVGGALWSGVKKVGGKAAASKAGKMLRLDHIDAFINSKGAKAWWDATKNLESRIQLGGFGSEILEEEADAVLQALIVQDTSLSDAMSMENQIQILCGVALMNGSMGLVRTGTWGAGYANAKRKYNKSNREAERLFGKAEWNALRNKIDMADDASLVDELMNVVTSQNLTDEQKYAAEKYVFELQRYRGYNLAGDVQRKDDVYNALYEQGYDAEGEDRKVIVSDYVKTRSMADDVFNGDADAMLDTYGLQGKQLENAINADQVISENDKKALIEYARAKHRYNAMSTRIDDDVNNEIAEAGKAIDAAVNSDTNMLTRVQVKGSDKVYYVKAGTLAYDATTGEVFADKSEDMIVLYDAEAQKAEAVSKNEIERVVDNADANEYKQTTLQPMIDAKKAEQLAIIGEYEAEAMNEVERMRAERANATPEANAEETTPEANDNETAPVAEEGNYPAELTEGVTDEAMIPYLQRQYDRHKDYATIDEMRKLAQYAYERDQLEPRDTRHIEAHKKYIDLREAVEGRKFAKKETAPVVEDVKPTEETAPVVEDVKAIVEPAETRRGQEVNIEDVIALYASDDAGKAEAMRNAKAEDYEGIIADLEAEREMAIAYANGEPASEKPTEWEYWAEREGLTEPTEETTPEANDNETAPVAEEVKPKLTPMQEAWGNAVEARVAEWNDNTGSKAVRVVKSIDEVTDAYVLKQLQEGKKATGWYDTNAKQVVIYAPNIENMKDVDKTFIHEVVGHDGIRALFGNEKDVNAFYDKVYDIIPEDVRERLSGYPGVENIKDVATKRRAIADEYVAKLAEKEISEMDKAERTAWDKIVAWIRDAVTRILGKTKLTEEDIREAIRASYAKMRAERNGVKVDVKAETNPIEDLKSVKAEAEKPTKPKRRTKKATAKSEETTAAPEEVEPKVEETKPEVKKEKNKGKQFRVEEAASNFTLTQDNAGDFEYAIMNSISDAYSARGDYKKVKDVVVRVKGHTPNWSNFLRYDEATDEYVPVSDKILNVTIGDYNNTDYRRAKEDFDEFVAEYPNVKAVNVEIEDGASVADALEQIHTALKEKGIDFEFESNPYWANQYSAEDNDLSAGGTRFRVEDGDGNPINKDGSLVLEKVKDVSEITDKDFNEPYRNIELPILPKKVSRAIGNNEKPIVIKRNIFIKNKISHKDLKAEDSRKILKETLYSPNLYGQNQKKTRPYNWILIHLADRKSAIIVEVNENKNNVEVVNWHYLSGKGLVKKQKQAEREGGLILTLNSAAANTPNDLLYTDKDTNIFENTTKENELLFEGEEKKDDYEAIEDGLRFKIVDDEDVIKKFEAEPLVKTYRAMVKIGDKYYPPMSTKEDGKLREGNALGDIIQSEERPDLAIEKDGKYYFKLEKDNDDNLEARYNPYLHTSDWMMNDQFKQAGDRPNLVVVEMGLLPSDLESGYHAEKAKDPTGWVAGGWKAGDVANQLPIKRQVALTQYGKMLREVPTQEVAEHIYKLIDGYVDVLPTNMFAPQVREALENMGMQFVKTDNQGYVLEGENAGKTWASVYGEMTKARNAKKAKKAKKTEDGDMLVEAAKKATKKATKKTKKAAEKVDEGDAVSVEPNGNLRFNVLTFEDWTDSNGVTHEGTKSQVLNRMMEKNFSEKDVADMERKMTEAYAYMKKLEELSDAEGRVRFDKLVEWAKQRPNYKQIGKDYIKAITSLVSNGDYPINLELTTDCIKREAFTHLLNALVRRGADLSAMGPAEIVTIQKMMKQYGIEVACDLCFVEGKRLQIVHWAQQIVDDWNKSLIEAGVNTDEEFGFGQDGEAFIPVEEWESYKDKSAVAKTKSTIDEVLQLFGNVNPEDIAKQKRKNAKAVEQYKAEKAEKWAKRTGKPASEWKPTKEQKREIKKLKNEGLAVEYVGKNMNAYKKAFERMRAEWVENNPGKDVLSFTPTAKQWDELGKIRNKQIGDVQQKMVRLIMEYPEMRKKMTLNDLLGSKVLMDIRQQHGEAYAQLYSIILQRFGTGTPKPVQDAVPYDGEVMTLSEKDYEKANKIGGARLFSFSDFDITKVFDYMQMFFDLEANKQRLQSYTKEIAAPLIFGKSNVKMNISTLAKAIVPDSVKEEYKRASEKIKKALQHKWAENAGLIVDENGKISGINFSKEHSVSPEFAQEIFHDDERNKDCGAIMVGCSVNHAIYSALQDWIRMVIPFHLSGMPLAARDKTDVLWYTDFTEYQSTRKKTSGGWSKISDKEDTFKFYDDMDKEGWNMRDKTREYLAWCEKNGYRPKFDWGINSQKYVEYCEENGYTPNQELIDAMDKDTENGVWNQYYKFLTDFTAYKPVFNEKGEMIDEIPSPQKPIVTDFDMSEVEKEVLFEGENSILAHREGNIKKTNQHIEELADKAERYLAGEVTEEELNLRDDVFYDSSADARKYLDANAGKKLSYDRGTRFRVDDEYAPVWDEGESFAEAQMRVNRKKHVLEVEVMRMERKKALGRDVDEADLEAKKAELDKLTKDAITLEIGPSAPVRADGEDHDSYSRRMEAYENALNEWRSKRWGEDSVLDAMLRDASNAYADMTDEEFRAYMDKEKERNNLSVKEMKAIIKNQIRERRRYIDVENWALEEYLHDLTGKTTEEQRKQIPFILEGSHTAPVDRKDGRYKKYLYDTGKVDVSMEIEDKDVLLRNGTNVDNHALTANQHGLRQSDVVEYAVDNDAKIYLTDNQWNALVRMPNGDIYVLDRYGVQYAMYLKPSIWIDGISKDDAQLVGMFLRGEAQQMTPRGLREYVEDKEYDKDTLDIARDVRRWYEEAWALLELEGMTYKKEAIEDYVTHIWDLKASSPTAVTTMQKFVAATAPKALKDVNNYVATNTPYMRTRAIASLRDGMELGLVPKYEDIVDILRDYGHRLNESVANRRLVNFVKGLEVNGMPAIREEGSKAGEGLYVPIKNNALRGYEVHTDVKPVLDIIFGEYHTSDNVWVQKIGKGWDMWGGLMKKINLSLSFFHHGALTESAIAMMGLKALKVVAKNIIWDAVIKGHLPAFHDTKLTADAVKHFVQLGATNDYSAKDVQLITEKLAKWAEGIVGVEQAANFVDFANKGLDKILWDYLHDGLKIYSYGKLADEIRAKAEKQGWDEETLNKALDEAGQLINDTFGGQHWDLMGVSPNTLKWARRLLLSPDWTLSSMRQALAPFGIGQLYADDKFWKKWGKHDDVASVRKKYGRSFWLTAFIFFGITMNALNAMLRAKDEEEEKKKADEIRKTNPDYKSPYEIVYPEGMKWWDYTMLGNAQGHQTHLFMGRYADGKEGYLRWGKQFRELPELFLGRDGLGFPDPMIDKIVGKLNPMINFMTNIVGGISPTGYENPFMRDKKGTERNLGRLMVLATAHMPYSIPTDEEKEFKLIDLVMPSTKGFSTWKAIDRFKTGIKDADMDYINKVIKACVMNGVDAEETLNAAMKQVEVELKEAMMEGVENLEDAMNQYDTETNPMRKMQLRNYIRKQLSAQEWKEVDVQALLEDAYAMINGGVSAKNIKKYDELTTLQDVTEDWRIDHALAGLKEYEDQWKEVKESGDTIAQAIFHRDKGAYIEKATHLHKVERAVNEMKKKLGKGNDEEVMKDLRSIRDEAFNPTRERVPKPMKANKPKPEKSTEAIRAGIYKNK